MAFNHGVLGSSPNGGTKKIFDIWNSCPCSSIGRMSVSKTEDEGSSPYMGAIRSVSLIGKIRAL